MKKIRTFSYLVSDLKLKKSKPGRKIISGYHFQVYLNKW